MFAGWAAGPPGLLLADASSAPHSLASQRVQVSFSFVILGRGFDFSLGRVDNMMGWLSNCALTGAKNIL
jgi:hypothetical protein